MWWTMMIHRCVLHFDLTRKELVIIKFRGFVAFIPKTYGALHSIRALVPSILVYIWCEDTVSTFGCQISRFYHFFMLCGTGIWSLLLFWHFRLCFQCSRWVTSAFSCASTEIYDYEVVWNKITITIHCGAYYLQPMYCIASNFKVAGYLMCRLQFHLSPSFSLQDMLAVSWKYEPRRSPDREGPCIIRDASERLIHWQNLSGLSSRRFRSIIVDFTMTQCGVKMNSTTMSVVFL